MDYAIVLAGGSGKRLWPLSRQHKPKQVLKILEDGQSLLRKCFQRLTPIFDAKNIIILTNATYAGMVKENLPELSANQVITEPVVRDTACTIGLAALLLTKTDPDATMAVVTADQLIEPVEAFTEAMKDGLSFVNNNPDKLITFGIQPTAESPEYGYIKCIEPKNYPYCKGKVYKVGEFKEKPTPEKAKEYLREGDFFWNSGMFVWKARTILENMEKYLPEAMEPLRKIQEDWDGPRHKQTFYEWFVKLPKISIDYAIMENAQNVYAIKLECRWLDLGAFSAFAEFVESDKDDNIIIADHGQLLDCKNNIIVTEQQNHLIAAIGLENMVIVHTPDATLICGREQTKRLKELLEIIYRNTGDKFL